MEVYPRIPYCSRAMSQTTATTTSASGIRSVGSSCPVCLEDDLDLVIVCENNHLCCQSCHRGLHTFTCPICRCELRIPQIEIPYSDVYTREEVVSSPLAEIMRKFKIHNIVRFHERNFDSVFTDSLQYATSAKENKVYKLYRGLTSKLDTSTTYADRFPSSWTTSREVATKFAGRSGQRLTMTVESSAVLFDYVYVNGSDTEKEVVILPGTYPCALDIEEIDISLHRDVLIADRKVKIERLKTECRKRGIHGYSKLRRAELIDLLQQRQSS